MTEEEGCEQYVLQARHLEGDVMESSLTGGLTVFFWCFAWTAKGTSMNYSQGKRGRTTIVRRLFLFLKKRQNPCPSQIKILTSVAKKRGPSPPLSTGAALSWPLQIAGY